MIRCPPLVIYTAPESDFARANTGQSRNQHRLTANTETIIYIYIESLKLMGEMRMRVDGDISKYIRLKGWQSHDTEPLIKILVIERKKYIYLYYVLVQYMYCIYCIRDQWLRADWRYADCRVRLCSEPRLLQIKHILFYFILFYVCARTTDLPSNSTFILTFK